MGKHPEDFKYKLYTCVIAGDNTISNLLDKWKNPVLQNNADQVPVLKIPVNERYQGVKTGEQPN